MGRSSWLWSTWVGLAGCGLKQINPVWFPPLLISSVCCLFVLLFLYIIWLSSEEAGEGYIKCKLSDGGSPRHLNTFSNLFIVAVHYTHQGMSLLLTAPIQGQLQLPSKTSNITQENTTAGISSGHGNKE